MPAPVPRPDLCVLRLTCALAAMPVGMTAAWAQSSQDLEQIQEQIDQGKIEAGELKQKADSLAKDVSRAQRRSVPALQRDQPRLQQ